MLNSSTNPDKNYIYQMWGSKEYKESIDSKKRVIQEIMHDYAPKYNFNKQNELHEKIRNDKDYDDWEYGTEPSYGNSWK